MPTHGRARSPHQGAPPRQRAHRQRAGLQAAHLSLGAMQSDKALACIRPDDDDASNTDSTCGGAHNRPSYPANSWTQGSPAARTQTPKLDYTKPENWPSGSVTPQYRALGKWLNARPLALGYRAAQTLECTRATEDNAIKTDPTCAGWTGPW